MDEEKMEKCEMIQCRIVPVVRQCIEDFGEEATKSALHWVLMKLYQNELENCEKHQAALLKQKIREIVCEIQKNGYEI